MNADNVPVSKFSIMKRPMEWPSESEEEGRGERWINTTFHQRLLSLAPRVFNGFIP